MTYHIVCVLMCACVRQKYSAASLCTITTEVLKVLNATEELIGEAEGKGYGPNESPTGIPLSSGPDSRKLDHQLTKMEENVRPQSNEKTKHVYCVGKRVQQMYSLWHECYGKY